MPPDRVYREKEFIFQTKRTDFVESRGKNFYEIILKKKTMEKNYPRRSEIRRRFRSLTETYDYIIYLNEKKKFLSDFNIFTR